MKSGLTVVALDGAMRELQEKLKMTITQDVYEFYKRTHLIPDIAIHIPAVDVERIGAAKTQVMGVPEVIVRIGFQVAD